MEYNYLIKEIENIINDTDSENIKIKFVSNNKETKYININRGVLLCFYDSIRK
jgi:hypothetical protein